MTRVLLNHFLKTCVYIGDNRIYRGVGGGVGNGKVQFASGDVGGENK